MAMLPAPASAKVLKWMCTYPIVANANGTTKGQSYDLTITFDDQTKKAVAIHNGRQSDVEVFAGANGLTFIERQPTGAIQTTTIDSAGKSVNSRHMLIDGLLVPSQSYGTCAPE
jgi:hypothetical protein